MEVLFNMETKKSIFTSATFGFISFLLAFALGSILTYSTGLPLIGGLLNGVITGMVLTIGLISRKFKFNATIMWLVFSVFATLTTTLGPPGIYKIMIGLIAGLLWDFFYAFISKYKTWGLYLGGLLGSASIMFTLVFFLSFGFGKNSFETLEKYKEKFIIILVMNLIITIIGIILGNIVYRKRLCNLPQFKNLRD